MKTEVLKGFLKYDYENNEYILVHDLDESVIIVEGKISGPGYSICKSVQTGGLMCPLALIDYDQLHQAAKNNAQARYLPNENSFSGCPSCLK